MWAKATSIFLRGARTAVAMRRSVPELPKLFWLNQTQQLNKPKPLDRFERKSQPSFPQQVESFSESTGFVMVDDKPTKKESADQFSYQFNSCGVAALICDFDGTLAKTSPVHAQALKLICQEYGLDFPFEYIADEVERCRAVKRFLYAPPEKSFGKLFKGRWEEAHQLFKKTCFNLYQSEPVELMPGVQELVDELRRLKPVLAKKGKRLILGITSHSPDPIVNYLVGKLGISDVIDFCQGSNHPFLLDKPHPSVIHQFVNPHDASGRKVPIIFYGDGPGDAKAAEKYGAVFFAARESTILSRGSLDETPGKPPAHFLSGASELRELIRSMEPAIVGYKRKTNAEIRAMIAPIDFPPSQLQQVSMMQQSVVDTARQNG